MYLAMFVPAVSLLDATSRIIQDALYMKMV